MLNLLVSVDAEMSERIVQDLFLYFELSNNIAIKLGFQLESHSFYVGYIVTNLSFAFLKMRNLRLGDVKIRNAFVL